MDEKSKNKLRGLGVTVLEQSPLMNNMPIHTLRFIHFKLFLKENEEKYKDSRILITDTRDIIFQKDPFEINMLYGMYKEPIFTLEGIKYKDEDWGMKNYLDTFGQFLYDEMKDNMILNVGILNATYQDMIKICQNIFLMCHYNNNHNPICDQAVFNYVCWNTPNRYDTFNDTLFTYAAHLGVVMDPNKIEKFKDKLCIGMYDLPKFENGNVVVDCNGWNSIIPIVHQWDRIPELKTYFTEKYKD
jgi:hypothetical protein